MAVTAPCSFLSLSLLLLLLLANGDGASTVEYQTLVFTPLQKPHALRDDYLLDETLADSGAAREGESDLLSTTAAAAASLQVRVAHRDSILASAAANSTAEEILRLRLDRDAARVDPGVARVHGARHGERRGVAPVRPCRRCYAQSDPIFDPRRSRSFAALPCAAPLCRRLDVSGCDLRRRSCLYQVSYGDGSVTTGDFSTETLTFSGGARVARVALGCGHDNEGLFVAAAGLLGLGRGALSFPSQAARRFGRRFSYCLVDRTSSSSSSSSSSAAPTPATRAPPPWSSGTPRRRRRGRRGLHPDGAEPQDGDVLLRGGDRDQRGRLPHPATDLRLDPSTGRGGAIVDSGTSVTRLARAAYAAVRDAFRAGAAAGLGGEAAEVAGGFSLFDTCYDLAGRDEVRVPTVALHLAGGAQGTFCFAFAGTDSGVSILGNIQQQGFRVVFDGDRDRLGFVPKGC
uniref:Peptidase A1 domain-containing protein n=1 Tax=Ananas comosus var. bracteatus TaxID=296719 RepID=A0A6V7P019_ANACO|nr:unnamed protein product [Ananas comosus var. bracteatus]